MGDEENKTEGQENSPALKKLDIPIHFRIPGRMPAIYAQHVLVQDGEDEFILSFFEVLPPLIDDNSPEGLEKLRQTGITAECVVRIATPKRRFIEFAQLMHQMATQAIGSQKQANEE